MQSPRSRSDAAPQPAWLRLPIDQIGLVLGPLVLIGWLLLVDTDLPAPAHRLAGVMLLTIIWWLTEPIPIAATALASIVLCVALGAVPPDAQGRFDPARTVFAPFADPSVFFLLGGLFIGRAMMRHGLDRRLALALLCTDWAARSPGTVLTAIGLAVTLLSMWISNTASTAMMFPVTIGIISVLGSHRASESNAAAPARDVAPPFGEFAYSPYATALLLITAYSSSVGGISTPIGTATNVLAMGYFKRPEYFGQPVDFLRWSMIGVPMTVLMLLGTVVWLRLQGRARGLDMGALRGYLRDEYAGLGKWKRGEQNTLAVFLLVVTLWLTPGMLALAGYTELRDVFSRHFPEEVTALLAPVFLFLLPVDWPARRFSLEISDFQKIDWGTVLLFGAGLSLGNLMFKTGLAEAVGHGVINLTGTTDVWLITAVAIAGGVILSEFTSNAATAATLIPVIMTICRSIDVDPIPPLMGVTLGASFGSALPVSTPPNAIVYGSGLIPVRRMIAAGIGVDVIAIIVIWIVLRIAYMFHWTPIAT